MVALGRPTPPQKLRGRGALGKAGPNRRGCGPRPQQARGRRLVATSPRVRLGGLPRTNTAPIDRW